VHQSKASKQGKPKTSPPSFATATAKCPRWNHATGGGHPFSMPAKLEQRNPLPDITTSHIAYCCISPCPSRSKIEPQNARGRNQTTDGTHKRRSWLLTSGAAYTTTINLLVIKRKKKTASERQRQPMNCGCGCETNATKTTPSHIESWTAGTNNIEKQQWTLRMTTASIDILTIYNMLQMTVQIVVTGVVNTSMHVDRSIDISPSWCGDLWIRGLVRHAQQTGWLDLGRCGYSTHARTVKNWWRPLHWFELCSS